MTDAVQAGRGWGLWLIFILGLIVAPVNASGILLWTWASTLHANETSREDAMGTIGFVVLGLVLIASIVGMVRRSSRLVTGMSLMQLFPSVFVLSSAAVSAL